MMIDTQKILLEDLQINPEFPLVLSVSGGLDSMTLLSSLLKTVFKLVVVHFNHQKRDESLVEKDMVESFAKKHGIPFHYYMIDVDHGNFHHQAHLLRTHYLCEVAKLYKTPYIVTAHHLDDLFENILIKLTRGSNLLGYSGMQQLHENHPYVFIKPLLFYSKEALIDYATSFHVPYLNDSSNEENTYLRNRYRHAIIPIMKQENPDMLNQIKQYHHLLSNSFKFLRNTSKLYVSKDMSLDIRRFEYLDRALQEDILAYLLENQKITFNFEMIQNMRNMLLSKKPNQRFALSNNHVLIKSYDEAKIIKQIPHQPICVALKEGTTKIKNVALFTFFINSNSNTADFYKLCYNELAFPLWLRHRKDGDLLRYDYGHKKLKKLLIDQKIPTETRDQLLILTDNNHQILWVEGLYTNQTLGQTNTLYFKLKR